jgi:hypothetical protein
MKRQTGAHQVGQQVAVFGLNGVELPTQLAVLLHGAREGQSSGGGAFVSNLDQPTHLVFLHSHTPMSAHLRYSPDSSNTCRVDFPVKSRDVASRLQNWNRLGAGFWMRWMA